METKTKMTTSQKAAELVQDLGLNHAIYITEEVISILEDWEGTELAKKDWVKIKEIIRSIEPFKEQVLLQSSIDGEVIWGDKPEDENCIYAGNTNILQQSGSCEKCGKQMWQHKTQIN